MIVGCTGFLLPLAFPAILTRTVGNHLIGIHVGLGTASRLPDLERKMFIQFTFDYFIGRPNDQFADVFVEGAGFHVRQRGRLFQYPSVRMISLGMVSVPILKFRSER
jgi:hypothetical protein